MGFSKLWALHFQGLIGVADVESSGIGTVICDRVVGRGSLLWDSR
ncbi:uncharacterized protein J3R85_003051 [Psidium guajava]|nr:uncharacterized protein J3R85_003051 [Psidium guajava]